jgi:hypothetical protein
LAVALGLTKFTPLVVMNWGHTLLPT